MPKHSLFPQLSLKIAINDVPIYPTICNRVITPSLIEKKSWVYFVEECQGFMGMDSLGTTINDCITFHDFEF
jgi:hypothetical protein